MPQSNQNGLNTIYLNQSDSDELFILANVEIPEDNLELLGIEIYTVEGGLINLGV